MQQAAARGMQAAGENGGGTGMAFMGMGMQAANGMMGGMQQPNTPSSYQPAFNQQQPVQQQAYQQPVQPMNEQPYQQPAQAQVTPEVQQAQPAPQAPAEDPTTRLLNAKKLLDAGAITQEDYDKLKAQVLGI